MAYLKTGGADDGFHGALGIGIVTDDAFAIGVTAVPDPIDDMEWDGWLYHRFWDIHSRGTFSNDDGHINAVSFEVDSKAMRKMTEGDTLFAIVQVVEAATATGSIWFDSRALFKLP